MVKGAWWHSAHFLVSLKARLSLARKARPRPIVALTFGAGSAAAAPIGRTHRAAKVVRRRMADPQVWVSRVVKEGAGGWAAGNRLILLGRKVGCQTSVRFSGAHPGGFRHSDRK